jgi:2-polyprenyl-6-methoxyphenol hydroxylase-like FAD-dependent oxidoreductase
MKVTPKTVDVAEIGIDYDAIVIGAGPAGCGTAACLAARGSSVLLVESAPRAARRFAGEWIHPEGARVLDSVGLLDGLPNRMETHGFVVHPNDGLGEIQLDHPRGARGFTIEHAALVRHLRQRVAALPNVDYVEGVRAEVLGANTVGLAVRGGRGKRLSAELVAVAGGRSARRAAASGPGGTEHVSISLMAGLLVRTRDFPSDRFGHVMLGGPGPVLAYRIDEERIRVCIDVPNAIRRGAHTPEWIWKSFAEVLPQGLRRGVRDALSSASLSWAANVFRPRRYQAGRGVALVGDAAGVFHPLTAMGITMSLLDAEALAASKNLGDYATARATASYVPELLSNAIYQAFVRDDPGAQAIRGAIFETWRGSRPQRDRTMRLLGASSTSRADFFRAFTRVALRAAGDALVDDPKTLPELAWWLRWPLATLHPEPAAVRTRSLGWAAPETWARRALFRPSGPRKETLHAD